MPHRAVYREHTPWPGWVWVILWGSLGVSAFLMASGALEAPAGERMLGMAVLLGVGVVMQFALGGVTVRLYPDRLEVGMGTARLIRSVIEYDRVLGVEAVRYSPLRDFGGWGYRMSGNKRAWTARGNEAVVLHLRDGRQVYIGSDRPDRLRERILTLGGTRIGA